MNKSDDAVPRTPEEDRPRLTREELDALTLACENRARVTLVGSAARKLVALAQRTVAAEAERHASIARFQELSLIDQERAEQAERTLAEIHGILDGPVYDATQAIYELRRLLQEG